MSGPECIGRSTFRSTTWDQKMPDALSPHLPSNETVLEISLPETYIARFIDTFAKFSWQPVHGQRKLRRARGQEAVNRFASSPLKSFDARVADCALLTAQARPELRKSRDRHHATADPDDRRRAAPSTGKNWTHPLPVYRCGHSSPQRPASRLSGERAAPTILLAESLRPPAPGFLPRTKSFHGDWLRGRTRSFVHR